MERLDILASFCSLDVWVESYLVGISEDKFLGEVHLLKFRTLHVATSQRSRDLDKQIRMLLKEQSDQDPPYLLF